MYNIGNLTKIPLGVMFCATLCLAEVSRANTMPAITQSSAKLISIHVKNETVKDALLQLSRESGISIGYDNRQLQLEKLKTKEKQFHNATIDDVLHHILKGTNISIQKTAGAIVLSKSQEATLLRIKVQNAQGVAIVGASVQLLPLNKTLSTDNNGFVEWTVPAGTYQVVTSHVSYERQTLANIQVGAQTALQVITLAEKDQLLNEVVVTALGLKREDKSLGYSVGKIKGEDMSRVANDNFMTAMSGKVPGVTINSTGPTGSSVSMVIRGATSLSNDNQPLFVVDGVPLTNSLNNVGQIGDGNKVDYGNAISNLNTEDIESVSILKGPSAAALYGSRAGNGVVLITTKSGKNADKLTVSFNSNTVFDIPYRFIKLHNKFASGTLPLTPNDLGNSNIIIDESSAYMMGTPLDKGYKAVQWNSPVDADGNRIPSELRSHPDNMKNFVQTGVTSINGISLANNSEKLHYRFSYSNLSNKGIIPNSDLYRNSINFNTTAKISDRVSLGVNLDASRNNSNNRPAGDRGTNPLQAAYEVPSHVNILDLKDYWVPGQEGLQQLSTSPGSKNNPYFLAYGINNAFVRDRVFGNVHLDWKITDNWDAMIRYATDIYWENRETKIPFSYNDEPNGAYGVVNITNMEQNVDFLTTYKKDLNDFHISASLGGNMRYFKGTSVNNSSKNGVGLITSGVYSLSNIAPANLNYGSYLSQKGVNSLYGLVNMSYRDMVFLDVTGRNDWSSTLPINNRSYFYPSASLSVLVDQIIPLPEQINLFKLRGGIARVGNDTSPYNLSNVLANPGTWGDALRLTKSGTLLTPNLKPEQSTSYEYGTDIGLLNNRLRLEATYYKVENRNQILPMALPGSSGFNSMNINAGLLTSKGIEIGVSGRPVQKENWTWDISANWSRNRTRINELSEGVEFHQFWSDGRGAARTYLGDEVGDLYDSRLVVVEDVNSPYYGYPLLNNNGSWQAIRVNNNSRNKIGNFNPDFSMGIQSSVRYKRLTMNVAADMRFGGEFISQTFRYFGSNHATQYYLDNLIHPNGMSGDALRDYLVNNDLVRVKGNYFPIVGGPSEEYGGYPITNGGTTGNYGVFNPGVIAQYDANGAITGYTENLGGEGTKYIGTSNNYPWDFMNASTFDASFIKLRELSFNYDLTGDWLKRIGISNGSVGVYTRNLILWTKADVGVDPELAFQPDGGGFKQGIERYNVTPWSLPLGFKLNVTF